MSDEYKSRRRRQMLLFFGSSVVTLVCSRLAYKGTIMRKYVPTLFHANHLPPVYSFSSDAAAAVGTATGLSGSIFCMVLFGNCWIFDISSMKEFGIRMKSLLGGNKNNAALLDNMNSDDESKIFQSQLNDFLSGKVDFDFDDKPVEKN